MDSVCSHCDVLLKKEDVITYSGMEYCYACIEDSHICCECSDRVFPEDEYEELNNSIYCRNCYADNIGICESCDNKEHVDDMHYVQNSSICDRCYRDDVSECYGCGKELFLDNMTYAKDDSYCDSCYSDTFTSCCECNDVIYRDDCCSDDDGDYCKSCWIERSGKDALASIIEETPYTDCISTFSIGSEYKTSKKDIYFGLEIEYIFKNEDSIDKDDIQNYKNAMLYLSNERVCLPKSDSSVDIEFTFPPSKYNVLSKKIDIFLSKIDDLNLFCEDNTAGIHIHVGKHHLSNLNWNKLLYFINNPSHSRYITYIARRPATNYCDRYALKRLKINNTDGCRYTSLNFNTYGKGTVEFRLFKTSTGPHFIKSYLQFIISSMRWVQITSFNDLSMENYTNYVIKNKKEFPNLYVVMDEIVRGGIIKDSLSNPEYRVHNLSISRSEIVEMWSDGFYKKRSPIVNTEIK